MADFKKEKMIATFFSSLNELEILAVLWVATDKALSFSQIYKSVNCRLEGRGKSTIELPDISLLLKAMTNNGVLTEAWRKTNGEITSKDSFQPGNWMDLSDPLCPKRVWIAACVPDEIMALILKTLISVYPFGKNLFKKALDAIHDV